MQDPPQEKLVVRRNIMDEYMSIEKISDGYKIDAVWAKDKWLSSPSTLELIQNWELMHNPDFNNDTYKDLCFTALSNGCSPEIEELIKYANAQSFIVDLTDIYMHQDIAIDFAQFLSPAFKGYCTLSLKKGRALNFKNEEDYIISNRALAEDVKKDSIEAFEYQVSAKISKIKKE